MEKRPNREEALELLKKYNDDALVKHGMAVEAVMLHFAKLYEEEDIEKWGIVGLLHDLDYGMYPDEHCVKTVELLEAEDYPKDYIDAMVSHGYGICEGVTAEPTHIMEKVLYATDELTGLVTATVLVRPSKSILDLNVKSVKKKWKDKGFARGVNREIIQNGIDMLGMERDEVIEEVINGMREKAEELGLKGEL